MEGERPLLNLEQVRRYILEALQVFELGVEHDSRGVYADFCLSHLMPYTNLAYRETAGAKHSSPLKHFTVERKKQKGHRGISDSYIYLSNSDKLLALAGVHVLTDHQKKSVVDKNIIGLRLGLPAKTVAPMLNYCIDCQLMEFGERLSTTEVKYGMYQINDRKYPGVKLDQHKVFRALREDSLNEILDEQTRMEFKSLYMGALLVESSRRNRPSSNILHVGYLHYKEGKDMLFCVDNDSGLLLALVEIPNVKKTNGPKPYYRVKHEILDALFGCLLSVACGPHKRIVNVNIHDMRIFDGWECEIFHMDGEWRGRTPPSEGYRQKMPDVLAAVLYRLLYTLENECEARKHQFWHSILSNKRWEDTVILRYRDTQWSKLDNFPIRRRQFRREPVLMAPSGWEFVEVPEVFKKHISDVSLQCESHPLNPPTAQAIALAEIPRRRHRDSEHFFNYEFMEEPMDDQTFFEFPNFEKLNITVESLKVLLYIYIFKRVKPIEMQKFADMELDKKEEIFAVYWEFFEQGSEELIAELTTGRPKFARKKLPDELVKEMHAHSSILESQYSPIAWGKMFPYVRPPAPILKRTTTDAVESVDDNSEAAGVDSNDQNGVDLSNRRAQQNGFHENGGRNDSVAMRIPEVMDERDDEPMPLSPEEMMGRDDEPFPRSPEEVIERDSEPVPLGTPEEVIEHDDEPISAPPPEEVVDHIDDRVPQRLGEVTSRASKEIADDESALLTAFNSHVATADDSSKEIIRHEPATTASESPLLSEDDTFSMSLEESNLRNHPGDLKRSAAEPVADKKEKRLRHQAPRRSDVIRKLKGKLKVK